MISTTTVTSDRNRKQDNINFSIPINVIFDFLRFKNPWKRRKSITSGIKIRDDIFIDISSPTTKEIFTNPLFEKCRSWCSIW